MVKEKGPGDVKYPSGKPKSLKKMPDGHPYPYERTYDAYGGVSDDSKVESRQGKVKYSPKPLKNVGDDGSGGHK